MHRKTHTHTQENVKKESRSGKMEEIYVMEVMEELDKPSINHVGRNIGCCIYKWRKIK